ncbi:MAG: SDR family oxidoreductase [Rhodospirillales bacterium]
MASEDNTSKSTPVSVVFGGMHGSPRNIARTFKENGHHVIIVDKREAPDDGGETYCDHAISADLLDVDALPDIAAKIAAPYGRVTNIVYGFRFRGPEEQAWDGEIALGLTVPRVTIEHLLPYFSEGGSIVFISSTASRFVAPTTSLAYQCVKAATDQMMRYYAYTLGPNGIRVNAVSPGFIVKDESMKYFLADEEKAQRVYADHPLRRIGKADEIATVVNFLCDDASSFVSGQIIDIDGGLGVQQPGSGSW